MNLYCSLDEAWGSDAIDTKKNYKNNYIESNIENKHSLNNNFESQINYSISKNECKELLKKILSCKECEELLYNYFKYKTNLQNNNYSNLNIFQKISNNDIINIILIGLCIIFLLDFFVKIGKLQN